MGVAALVIMAVAAAASTAASVVGGNQQRAAARHAQDLSNQAAAEQNAQRAQDQAQQAREQYRQDRVRRAAILQNSSNTGGAQSSGEIGALGSMQTQYAVNQGNAQGAYERQNTIGGLQQAANQSIFNGQQSAGLTSNIGSIFGAASNIAGSYYSATSKAKIPGTTPQATVGQ